VRLHCLAARALQFEDAHRALPASDRELVIEHGAGRAGTFALGRAQRLDAQPSPAISNQAPGTGDKPRTWLCTSCHGRSQAIRVSSFAILCA